MLSSYRRTCVEHAPEMAVEPRAAKLFKGTEAVTVRHVLTAHCILYWCVCAVGQLGQGACIGASSLAGLLASALAAESRRHGQSRSIRQGVAASHAGCWPGGACHRAALAAEAARPGRDHGSRGSIWVSEAHHQDCLMWPLIVCSTDCWH